MPRKATASAFGGPLLCTYAQSRRSLYRNVACAAVAHLGPALTAGLVLSGKARAIDIANVTIADSDTSTLLLLLLLMFGVLTAVLHLAGRHRWTRRERELANELVRTHAQLERANLFLASEPQIVVAWDGPNAKPRFEGDLALIGDAPSPERTLDFLGVAGACRGGKGRRDRAEAARARRILLACRGGHKRPALRNHRTRDRRRRRDSSARRLRRPPAIDASDRGSHCGGRLHSRIRRSCSTCSQTPPGCAPATA